MTYQVLHSTSSQTISGTLIIATWLFFAAIIKVDHFQSGSIALYAYRIYVPLFV